MAYVKQGKLSNYKQKKYLAPNKYNKIIIKTTNTESAKKLKAKITHLIEFRPGLERPSSYVHDG